MVTLFNDQPFGEVVAGLRAIGYHGALLEENYEFVDYFKSRREDRQINAAAFGQTPTSYDSALIGVALTNGYREQALVNRFRALGAPILLEVDNYEVREWAVSRKENEHGLVARYPADRITQMIAHRARDWKPEPLLRAKNIGAFEEASQLSLFAGLLPELEEHIQAQLEPLLREALSTTRAVYYDVNGHDPKPSELFKLIFWILTAKVFNDRRVKGFDSLGADPDAILAAVAKQYDDEPPRLLNRKARQAAVDCIWNELDFRNLSVEVLAQIWSTSLVDDEVKKRLGIHRTPRTIVRYIVERIPLQQPGDDPRIIFEPCAGSAAFLIGAMNSLRPHLFLMTPYERHKYFTKHLEGIEKDDFGVEISHLVLALSDFPNLSGWTRKITKGDVFEPGALTNYLRRAGVVLCNPPFEPFDTDGERETYQVKSPWKPVELLNRVLDDLHPSGVLGFVLPRNIVDGQGYKEIRSRIAKRFASVDLTVLPDKAFEADTEVGLLIATEPIPHDTCQISFSKVNDTAETWRQFELKYKVSSEFKVTRTVRDAAETFAVHELPNVWKFLAPYPTLKDVAKLHRGIEWNKPLTKKGKETGFRAEVVRERQPPNDFRLGVAPQTSFSVFELPRLYYLSFRPQDERGHSFNREWDSPKAIVNKSTRSRGRWRMAAFPDSEGLAFYQTYIGVWPTTTDYDEVLLAAILNSPVANAFVATREGKTDITLETLEDIPVPHFTATQRDKLRDLVKEYQRSISSLPMESTVSVDPSRLLIEIDALVLDGYRMPPRLENEVLNFFQGQGKDRPTKQEFGDYLPPNCQVYFSLSTHLSPKFQAATVGKLLERMGLG